MFLLALLLVYVASVDIPIFTTCNCLIDGDEVTVDEEPSWVTDSIDAEGIPTAGSALTITMEGTLTSTYSVAAELNAVVRIQDAIFTATPLETISRNFCTETGIDCETIGDQTGAVTDNVPDDVIPGEYYTVSVQIESEGNCNSCTEFSIFILEGSSDGAASEGLNYMLL